MMTLVNTGQAFVSSLRVAVDLHVCSLSDSTFQGDAQREAERTHNSGNSAQQWDLFECSAEASWRRST